MQIKKPSTLLKNLIWVSLGQLGSGFLYMAALGFIARYLGKTGLGEYSYIFSLVNIFQFVADLGIASIFTREISKEKGLLGKMLGNLKSMYWILSFISMAIIISAVTLTSRDPGTRLAAWPAAIATMALFHSFGYATVFRAFEHMHINSLGLVLARFLFLVFTLVAIKLQSGLTGIFCAMALSSLALWWTYYAVMRRRYIKPRFAADFPTWGYMLREGSSAGGSIILRKSSWYIDIFMLRGLATTAAVGLFSSIYQVIQILYLLPWTLSVAFMPVFSRLDRDNPRQLHEMLTNLVKLSWLVTLPIAVITSVTSGQIITFLFGGDFSQAGSGLPILIWTIPFLFPTSLFFFFFTAIGKQRAYLICVGAAIATKTALNLALIPQMGYIGSCWATILSDFSHYWISIWLLKKSAYPLKSTKIMALPALGSLLAGLCLIPAIGSPSISRTGVCAFFYLSIYAGLTIASKYVKRDDIAIMLCASGSAIRKAQVKETS
jgi:PST family polysaccharide transporter